MSAFEKLTLNGYTYPADELLHICEQKIRHGDADDDEFALYEFIQDWLAPSEFIEVSTSGSTGTPTIMTLEKRQFIESAANDLQLLWTQGRLKYAALPFCGIYRRQDDGSTCFCERGKLVYGSSFR